MGKKQRRMMKIFLHIFLALYIVLLLVYYVTNIPSLLVIGAILGFFYTILVLVERRSNHSITLFFILRLLSLWLALILLIVLKNCPIYVFSIIIFLDFVLSLIEEAKKEKAEKNLNGKTEGASMDEAEGGFEGKKYIALICFAIIFLVVEGVQLFMSL